MTSPVGVEKRTSAAVKRAAYYGTAEPCPSCDSLFPASQMLSKLANRKI